MYQNNISERSSSRVLQQPGGRQTYNIFGGSDQQEPEQPRKGRGQIPQQSQPNPTQPLQSQSQAKPTLSSHSSSIGAVFNEEQNVAPANTNAAGVPSVQAPFAQDSDSATAAGVKSTPRSVNNIWGSDDDASQKPSTRVLNRPGGSSSGVAGALGGSEPQASTNKRPGAYRSNQTSANSPFSTEPVQQRSSTRVHHAPGGQQTSNILSWGQ